MKYKGHFDIMRDASGYSKARIISAGRENEIVMKEYTFHDGRVRDIVDNINRIVSRYSYDSENAFSVEFYRFEGRPSNKLLDSIKEITVVQGLEISETLYEVSDGERKKVYHCERVFEEEDLMKEVYHYSDSDYVLLYSWDKKGRIKTLDYPDSDRKVEYVFNREGYLKEFRDFKYAGYCQRMEYEYEDGRLRCMKEFPHLPFKRRFFTNSMVIIGDPDFIHESTFSYQMGPGLLEKEVKKDIISGNTIEIIEYQYEK